MIPIGKFSFSSLFELVPLRLARSSHTLVRELQGYLSSVVMVAWPWEPQSELGPDTLAQADRKSVV